MPLSAHLPGTLRASHSPSGGLPRRGGCPAERYGFPFLLTMHGRAPYSTAVGGQILHALGAGFYLMHTSEEGYLQPRTSEQGGEGDDTCVGAEYQRLSWAPASSSSASSTRPLPKGVQGWGRLRASAALSCAPRLPVCREVSVSAPQEKPPSCLRA